MQKRISNLDGLRFIAAWIVVFSHLENFKSLFKLNSIKARFFSHSADIAVTFFFVLSGFLITWLLLSEKTKHASGKINISSFYKKRILRIWPLYYLLILITFFILERIPFFCVDPPSDLSKERLISYSLFMPNYTLIRYGAERYLRQTWSLGVEEFFYLFFPICVYVFKMKTFRYFLIFVIVVFFVLSFGMNFIYLSPKKQFNIYFYYFVDRYRLYSFCLGGLSAWYLLNEAGKTTIIGHILSSKKMANLLLLILVILVVAGATFSIINLQVYSLFFAVFLYSIVKSKVKFAVLNKPFMIYFGKISYGIYMLHGIAIVIALRLFPAVTDNIFLNNIILITITTLITLFLSILSYEVFEKRFLKFRRGKEPKVVTE